jgi:hypothetical protein
MHRVDQIVSAALSRYENQRLAAGAPECIHSKRRDVQAAVENQLAPNDVIDRLIMLATAKPSSAKEPLDFMGEAEAPKAKAKSTKKMSGVRKDVEPAEAN